MGAAFQAQLVTNNAVLKIHFVGEAALGEELEGPVDGGVADARIAVSHEPVKLFSAEVFACLEEDVEDAVALGALFKTLFAKMVGKDPICFLDQISAIRTHIVHAFSG